MSYQFNVEQKRSWRYSDVFLRSLLSTSYDTNWNSISLKYQHQPTASQEHMLISSFYGLSPRQLKPVIDYINNYLDQDLGLAELAAIAQLSQYHFSRAFKRSTGMSPHQYVIQQRVERAKLLLREKKMSICEVAIAYGFTYQRYLNRHFKRLIGMTPKPLIKLQ